MLHVTCDLRNIFIGNYGTNMEIIHFKIKILHLGQYMKKVFYFFKIQQYHLKLTRP